MQRIARGDQIAFLALYRRYVNLAFSVALRMLGDQAAAEEIVQDVFVSVWRNAGEFDSRRGRFSSWLLTITRRRAIDELRRRNRVPAADSLDDPSRRVEGPLVNEERGREIRLALAELPAEQARCIELAFFLGMTHEEIARHLGLPAGTVKSRIMLGMRKLRAALLPSEEEPSII